MKPWYNDVLWKYDPYKNIIGNTQSRLIERDKGELCPTSLCRIRRAAMPASYANVDAYINSLDASRQAALQQLRRIIRETVPEADEMIRYNMPYYDYRGMLCAFASQKHYISFYLLNREIVEKNRRLLAGLNVGKGCIRFKDIRVLPEPTIRAMLREAAIANEAQPNDHC